MHPPGETLWQKAMALTQPSDLLGAAAAVGQDTAPLGEGSFWLPWPQHPWETGQWAGSVFTARFAFDNWCFGVWKPDFCARFGRGKKSTHVEGLLPAASHANTAREKTAALCVKPLKPKCRIWFVVFFKETLSALRWHNGLQMQFYPQVPAKC